MIKFKLFECKIEIFLVYGSLILSLFFIYYANFIYFLIWLKISSPWSYSSLSLTLFLRKISFWHYYCKYYRPLYAWFKFLIVDFIKVSYLKTTLIGFLTGKEEEFFWWEGGIGGRKFFCGILLYWIFCCFIIFSWLW